MDLLVIFVRSCSWQEIMILLLHITSGFFKLKSQFLNYEGIILYFHANTRYKIIAQLLQWIIGSK